jgi:DNA-binding response OmpR family regulator
MKTILIVDDDVCIGDMLQEVLVKEGYRTARAYSGTEALLYLSGSRPDLILLDLMLPGLSGEELLPLIEDIPVIVVSAKSETADKVNLLLGGADDYIAKPFDTDELLARIAVQLRRPATGTSSLLAFNGIRLDTSSRTAEVDGQPVRLTKTEYAILKLLMQNPSQVITKSVMLDRISEDTPDCVESSLKVHVSNLRKKLKDVNGKDYIEAVWGIGFKMNEG